MWTFFSRGAAPPAAPPELAFELALALHTDAGPVRTRNEDCIASLSAAQGAADGAARTLLVALADGMGGHQAGDLASRLALRAALQSFGASRGMRPITTSTRLLDALTAANAAVYDEARRHPQHAGMGTTVLLFAPTPQGLCFAWVGDSRLYRWRDGTLRQMTRDDTLVRGLWERGLIDREGMRQHPDHSVLSQAVGTHAQIPSPHVEGPVELALGDRYLLCSDGVHDVVGEAELQRLLGDGTPQSSVSDIAGAAVRNGTSDNVSAGVVHVLPPSPPAAARRTRCGEEAVS
jgi:serine/threonine protein phosphatase PrpC